MSELIGKELLKYLYVKKIREKKFKINIDDVFEEFNNEKKESLLESLETLSSEKMVYIQGTSIEEVKNGNYNHVSLIITQKGINSIETSENHSHDKLAELFKY